MSHHTSPDPGLRSAFDARRIVRDVCSDLAADTLDVALLLVSELTTNALTFGGGAAGLVVDVEADVLRVSVTDQEPRTPRVPQVPTDSEHGRGLQFVETLASRWGVDRHLPVGKTVWFELDRPGSADELTRV